jgi:diguanylate cyclase (GGDEF)-like protein
MMDVAMCVSMGHDPWLVVLAVFVCFVGAFTVTQMFERAQTTSGFQRFGWIFLTAVGAGATIWCTHFVAMLGFKPGVPVKIDPVLTILSLVIAIVGSGVGFGFSTVRPSPVFRAIGGAIAGVAISSMHYTGMAAYRLDGIVRWRTSYVVVSVVCSIVFSAAALTVLGSKTARYRLSIGTGLLVTAIATLHFIAMTALQIEPLRVSEKALSGDEQQALGLATAMVGLLVIAGGVAAALIDRQTRSDALERMQHMAMFDSLTGLPNRANFKAELERQIVLARSSGTNLGLLVIDLERFKEINDVHGHKAGDEILILLAQRMRAEIQGDEVVARLGGDEFVALTRYENRDRLTSLAVALDTALRAPVRIASFTARVGASIGVATFPQDAGDADTLTNNADLAMYRAKSEGSQKPRFYEKVLDEAIRGRRELANDLRRALDEGQLAVHYQVQTSLVTHEVTGYEALVRWNHPVRGNIPPAHFIPVAEENGLILPLGEWVLRRACLDAMTWEHGSKVAVNVSPVQLAHADLPGLFQQILQESGLKANRLEIELTESAIMADRQHALGVLREIRALGITVALDDFGTGYSSLETLRVFRFDKIKLDRFFVSELEANPEALAIVRAVLALGKSLAIPVLAEGIERGEQFEVLRREGCDEAQGFLFGYPAPMPVPTTVHAMHSTYARRTVAAEESRV